MRAARALVAAAASFVAATGCGSFEGGGPGPATEPPLPECLARLRQAGVAVVPGPARPGIPDPVTVTMPIGGIEYFRWDAHAPRRAEVMDCRLALALLHASEVFRRHDVVAVYDLDFYQYRCEHPRARPPRCRGSELSQHAYGQAFDLSAVRTSDGAMVLVMFDWLIDGGPTVCPAPPDEPRSQRLHELVCDLYAAGIFGNHLTPNYNAAHRNHVHFDLAPGDRFLR